MFKVSQLLGLFTSPHNGAFMAVCELITTTCEPATSSKRKQTLLLDLFSSLHTNSIRLDTTAINEIEPERIQLGYFAFCDSLRGRDLRFNSLDVDEVLTLALLVDTDGDGTISWDDFYAFCSVCDEVADRESCENLFNELLAEKTSDLCQSDELGTLLEILALFSAKGISKMNMLLKSLESSNNESFISVDLLRSRMLDFLDNIDFPNKKEAVSVHLPTVLKFPDIFHLDQELSGLLPVSSVLSSSSAVGVGGAFASSGGSKRVWFAEDTAPPAYEQVAVTIISGQYLPSSSCVMYKIQLWQSGRIWTLDKRYSEFKVFYKKFKKENLFPSILLPSMPRKRWFESQRWLNRFDSKYIYTRRVALQQFLRSVLRLPNVSVLSSALNEFLDLQRVLSSVSSIYDGDPSGEAHALYQSHIETGGCSTAMARNPRDSLDVASFNLFINDSSGEATGAGDDVSDDENGEDDDF